MGVTTIQVTSWRESEHKAIRQQLARILHSGPFLHSRRLQRFLEYVVNETLAGRSERLKGYHLALEVFDRPATFDPIIEPIVRVEAARLREKLRQYYEADGRGDPIRIDLPKGTYAPQIEFRQATTRNNDAHDELLRGLKRFWCYTRESCAEAQHHFAQAAILDPEYAPAHAWLARTYHWQGLHELGSQFQIHNGPCNQTCAARCRARRPIITCPCNSGVGSAFPGRC